VITSVTNIITIEHLYENKNFTKEILRGHIYEDRITGLFQGRGAA